MAGPTLLFLLGYSDVKELWRRTVARSCLEGAPQKAIEGVLTLQGGQWGDISPAVQAKVERAKESQGTSRKFKVSIYLQTPLKSKSAEIWKVSLRNYDRIVALLSLFF